MSGTLSVCVGDDGWVELVAEGVPVTGDGSAIAIRLSPVIALAVAEDIRAALADDPPTIPAPGLSQYNGMERAE